jgi:hypothetical protein
MNRRAALTAPGYARALKPSMLHLVDRVLKVYAPAVLSLALTAALG